MENGAFAPERQANAPFSIIFLKTCYFKGVKRQRVKGEAKGKLGKMLMLTQGTLQMQSQLRMQ